MLEAIFHVDNLEFGQVWAVWLLPLPLLLLVLPPIKRKADALYTSMYSSFVASAGLRPSTGVYISGRSFGRYLVLVLVWSCLVVALMSPALVGEPEKKVKRSRNFLVAVDISASMSTTDWTNNNGQRVSRWDAVREVMAEFVEKREGDRIGLLVFASEPYVQAPFTTDLDLIEQLLEETAVGMAGQKTALGNSVGKAIELFAADTIEQKVLLLLTDGVDSGSELRPVQAARLAAADSVTIYTIGIGSTVSTLYELDERTLTEMANVSGGRFFKAQDREQLELVYATLEELEPIEFEENDFIPRRLLFYYPMGIALGITLLSIAFFLITSRVLRAGRLRSSGAA